MTLTKKDIIVAAVIALAFGLIGFGVGWKSKQVPVIDEDSKFAKVYAKLDSLDRIEKELSIHLDTIEARVVITDHSIGTNLKLLANEIKVVKKFTPTSRSRYLDSLLAVGDFK